MQRVVKPRHTVTAIRRMLRIIRNPETPPAVTVGAAKVVLEQWRWEQDCDPCKALIAILGDETQAYDWMEQQLAGRRARMLPESTEDERREDRDDPEPK